MFSSANECRIGANYDEPYNKNPDREPINHLFNVATLPLHMVPDAARHSLAAGWPRPLWRLEERRKP